MASPTSAPKEIMPFQFNSAERTAAASTGAREDIPPTPTPPMADRRREETEASHQDAPSSAGPPRKKMKPVKPATTAAAASTGASKDIPQPYLEAWTPGGGCTSRGCPGKGLATLYAFRLHWQKFHMRKVALVLCPGKDCKLRFRSRNSFKEHAKKSHPRLTEAAIKKAKTREFLNTKYKKPQLPEGRGGEEESAVRRGLGERSEGRNTGSIHQPAVPREERPSTSTVSDGQQVAAAVPSNKDGIPDVYIKAWSSNSHKGCTSRGCTKGQACSYPTYATFRSHWKKIHELEVEATVCPECKKEFRNIPSFRDHARKTHDLSDDDIKNAETKMVPNEKYIKPQPPEGAAGPGQEKMGEDVPVVSSTEDLELPREAAENWQKAEELELGAALLDQQEEWFRSWATEGAINRWLDNMAALPDFLREDRDLRQRLKEVKVRQARDTVKLILDHFSTQGKEKSTEANRLIMEAKKITNLHHQDGGDRIQKAEKESLIYKENELEKMGYKKKAPLTIEDIMNKA